MSQDIRRELISKNLSIKPINHGQIHTFQIALPESLKQSISLEKRQMIEKSLLAHQSNLISLIVRRTSAYNDEDIEYELVYGADWLQVAQALDIEKVWAWVFDMTDEQVEMAIAEMDFLTTSGTPSAAPSTTSESSADISTLIDQKLQLAADSIKHAITPLLNGIRQELDEKLKVLNHRIDQLNTGSSSSDLEAVLTKLEQLPLRSSARSSVIEFSGEPINLLEASDPDIRTALQQVNTQNSQIEGALRAIHHWKQSEEGLTWRNLERSAKAKTNSPYKIKGFGEGSYNRLRAIATLPETT